VSYTFAFQIILVLEIMQGSLPRKQLRLVQAWAELHLDELKAKLRIAVCDTCQFFMQCCKMTMIS